MNTFHQLWERTSKQYATTVAYYTADNEAVTYKQLAAQVRVLQKQCHEDHIIYIDGRALNWLTHAVAAWATGKTVLFFDGQIKPVHSCLDALETKGAHAIFFTSGTTGQPKAIVRSTDFALFEANAYVSDIQLTQNSLAVSQVFPWFGAMTKHTLGMLLHGIPQYFHMPTTLPANKTCILYCTPSQLTLPVSVSLHQWDMISLTGEPLNAVHVDILGQRLKPNGWVLDAFGQTECGVIARRKQPKHHLSKLSQNFCGDILPGKKVFVNESHALSIQLPNKQVIHIDDLGRTYRNQLTLYGRASTQRKVRGQWINVNPLLALCRTRKDIVHVELDAAQSEQSELILYVLAESTLKERTLHTWLLQRLSNIHLLPHIIISTPNSQLGRTGKAMLLKDAHVIKNRMPSGIQLMVESILTLGTAKNNRDLFKAHTFEEQGLSSLDIIELTRALEQQTGHQSLRGNILKTDTPIKIYQYLQAQNSTSVIKEVFNDSSTHQVICLGHPLSVIHQQFKGVAQLVHGDIIETQTELFSITALAQTLFQQGLPMFKQTKQRWIAAYSIHALLAIALCEILEKNNVPVQGVFLLDPPHNDRKRTLKRMYVLLRIRQKILKKLIKYQLYQNIERYRYELRKIAIARHPKITLKTKVLLVHTDPKQVNFPWLTKEVEQITSIVLDNIHHLALIKTKKAIDTWLPHMKCFFNLTKL
jgi:hypothetical protein